MGYEFKLRWTPEQLEAARNRKRAPRPQRKTTPAKPKTAVAPLRKVIGHIQIEAGEFRGEMLYYTHELLECFHHQPQKEDIYGPTNAARRRCLQCQKEEQALQNTLTP